MRKVLVIVLSLALFASCQSVNQNNTLATISVSGSSEVFMSPDMASFTVSAEALKQSSEEARSECDRIITEAVNILLEKYGITSDMVKTNYISLSPEYAYVDNQRQLLGQRSYQSINVTLYDICSIGSIVEELSKINGISISSITLDKKDKSKEKEEARALAVSDALAKAETYASALNKEVIDIVSLSDGSGQRDQSTMLRMEATAFVGASDNSYSTNFYSYDLSCKDSIELVVSIN